MKILKIQNWLVGAGAAAFLACSAQAQDNAQTPDISVVNSTAPAATAPAVPSAPQLANSVSQVLELSQAKISDGTIVSFIQNSQTTYPLVASQIVYLKQQGVSDLVLNAMLNQHPAMTASTLPAPAPTAAGTSASAETSSATVPTTTYVQSAPPSSVYVIPDTQTYYYDDWYYGYPYYYPPVVIGFGWGWGWHGGYGGYRGGFHGGFHR